MSQDRSRASSARVLPPVACPEPDARLSRTVPEATVVRLAVYLRELVALAEHGATTVSSEELAAAAGVGSAKLRKDLSFLGSQGTRGVGYDVPRLVSRLELTLGLDRAHSVALVGAGNLGRALVGYDGFSRRGFRVAALFDRDPARIGSVVRGVQVHHVDSLPAVCAQLGVSIGVVATPATSAQQVCDQLVAAGVRCVLNFAPAMLVTPEHVEVRQVDLAAELQVLSFHLARRAAATIGDGGGGVRVGGELDQPHERAGAGALR